MSYHGVLNYALYTNVFLAVQIHCAKTRNTKTLHFTTTIYVAVHVKIQGSVRLFYRQRRKER